MSTSTYVSKFSGASALAAGLAASSISTISFGENGAAEHGVEFLTKVQDLLVAINNFATHSKDRFGKFNFDKTLGSSIDKLSEIVPSDERKKVHQYLLRLLAHTRDCRKDGMGRGSREPTMYMFVKIYDKFPEYRNELKEFLHPYTRHYGSIGDLPRLYYYADKYPEIQSWVMSVMMDLIIGMRKQIVNTGKPMDLTAKHAPREGKKGNKMANALAMAIFPHMSVYQARKAYRQMVADGNRKLQTVETFMCGKSFSEIDFTKVPGVALSKYRLAWKNATKDGRNRSTEMDRILGAEHYGEFLESLTGPDSKGAKGTSMFITNICEKLLRVNDPSDIKLYTAQFDDQVKNLTECAEKNDIDIGEFLSNFVMLLDFSGSMTGEPMNLAFSMATLLGPMMKGPFQNKFLSFESKPRWVDMSTGSSIKEKLHICAGSPWGGNTNFVLAHQTIIDVLKEQYRLGTSKINVMEMLPRFFLVVSDMQFDAASSDGYSMTGSSRWSTIHQTLRDMYHTAGMEMFGEPLTMPTMVYWNARTDTTGMPVVASTPGAIMVTGYSSAIVKTFLTAGIEAMAKFTPWSYLKETLENEWYNKAVEGKFPIPDGRTVDTTSVPPPPVPTMDV